MEIIFLVISAFIAGLFSAFLFIDEKFIKKIKSSKNHVHFYVARDKYGCLGLFIGKPIIDSKTVTLPDNCTLLGGMTVISDFGLDANDYSNLKYGDKPVEVFLNLEE